MSQALTITGIYKNNKRYSVGTFNPKNNRNFNTEELEWLHKRVEEFKEQLPKFKEIEINGCTEGKQLVHLKVDNLDLVNINKVIEDIKQVS